MTASGEKALNHKQLVKIHSHDNRMYVLEQPEFISAKNCQPSGSWHTYDFKISKLAGSDYCYSQTKQIQIFCLTQ